MLHRAVRHLDLQAVMFLLEHGAQIDRANAKAERPLHWCGSRGLGSRPDGRNDQGRLARRQGRRL